jgi:hypothetical protein
MRLCGIIKEVKYLQDGVEILASISKVDSKKLMQNKEIKVIC